MRSIILGNITVVDIIRDDVNDVYEFVGLLNEAIKSQGRKIEILNNKLKAQIDYIFCLENIVDKTIIQTKSFIETKIELIETKIENRFDKINRKIEDYQGNVDAMINMFKNLKL